MFDIHHTLQLLCNVSIGLLSGVYFIFSNTVMRSLAKVENGANIMVTINEDILNPTFKLMFTTSAFLCLYLSWFGANIDPIDKAAYVVFFIGTFVVTVIKNIPANNSLKEHETNNQALPQMWQGYLKHWVVWNNVRTISAFFSLILLNF
jgi:uncharacterized membrane protein